MYSYNTSFVHQYNFPETTQRFPFLCQQKRMDLILEKNRCMKIHHHYRQKKRENCCVSAAYELGKSVTFYNRVSNEWQVKSRYLKHVNHSLTAGSKCITFQAFFQGIFMTFHQKFSLVPFYPSIRAPANDSNFKLEYCQIWKSGHSIYIFLSKATTFLL